MFGRLISRLPRDEEENEASRALTAILWILLLTFPLLLLGIIALPEFSARWLSILTAVYGITLPAFVLNRLGYSRVASFSLVIGLWVVATGAALTGGGIASFAALYYLMVVFISGLLLGQRAAIVTTGICILTALGLVLIEMTGYLPSTVIPHTPPSRWIIITLLVVTIMALQYLSVGRLHDALRQSRRELDERKITGRELQRVSERLQLATSAANIGIWDWHVINDELVWDDAMYRLYGLRKEDFSGAFDAWAQSLAPEDFDRANDNVQAALRGEREFADEFRIVWPDGSVHYTKAASRTFRDETGRPVRMVGLNYDITERKQAEERIALLQTITIDIAAARDLPSALEVVLRRVCEKTGWALGQAWIPNKEGTALSCCPAWFATTPSLEKFRAFTEDFDFKFREGLPGMVWALRQPVWMADVTQEENFPRARFASECGLKAGLGVPIISGDEVIAVLEFFLGEIRNEDERMVKLISAVAAQLDLMVERKQAEDALRESEAKFRVLTETAASGILIYQDGKYRYANPAAESITGYAKDEILEMGFGDLEHADFRELATQRTQARQRGEDVPSRYEVKIVDKNGNERWLDAANSFMEFQGKPAILITAFDITERKRAEHDLQRNEDLFRAIVEDQTEMIVRWKPDGTRTFVNQAYCRVFGGDPKDFIGTSFYPQVAEKYREDIQKKTHSLTPAKPLATEIHQSVSASGQVFWQEWTDRGIFDAQGNLVELQSTGRDITERRRAEEALRESERRLNDTLTNIDMIAVMSDINGDITFCNDYLLRLTDWKREEAIGRNWYEMFLPEGEKERVSGILGKVERTGEFTIHLENEIKTRSGECRLVKWTNTILRGLNGNVIGLAALGDDITERKQAEQQLKVSSDQLRALSERLRRAKEEEGIRIARELHDELGSALTSLKWSLLGLDKVYPGKNNSEGHSDVRVRIEEMVGLVDATVNTVRRISSELRPGVLDDLGLVSAIEWHSQQFQEQTGMVCQLESLADSVELDRDQATVVFRIFQEAMTNILRHAQATKTNILIEEEDGEFVLEITDNGRGITESETLGIRSLGLLGMRERANSIGAKIVITGIPGKGTRLIVRLPLNSEAAV